VITGQGAVSPLGQGVEALYAGLLEGRSGITRAVEMEGVTGLRPRVAGLIQETHARELPRKFRRTMSDMSIYALQACQEALAQARIPKERVVNGEMGLVFGSSVGSPRTMEEFFRQYLPGKSIEQVKSTLFFKIMSHSAAANISQALGIAGQTIAPSAACATGCLAIGLAFDMVASNRQPFVLCGGCDEFHPLTAATFDIIQAASFQYNDSPTLIPGPFDRQRDGVVCAEGAGALVVENLDSALNRGANVLAEIAGWACLSDPHNMASPGVESMADCMRKALEYAEILPEHVDYVNAHATGTQIGDPAESASIAEVLGGDVPVSSFKGHIGHTMAASGSLELIATVKCMKDNCVIPTKNLFEIDGMCRCVRHPQNLEQYPLRVAVKNSFALGGMNVAIILRRYPHD
jgi:3-oxoacyl-[acyl-carrier-protein] synthase II